jgi:hypothetical protein
MRFFALCPNVHTKAKDEGHVLNKWNYSGWFVGYSEGFVFLKNEPLEQSFDQLLEKR